MPFWVKRLNLLGCVFVVLGYFFTSSSFALTYFSNHFLFNTTGTVAMSASTSAEAMRFTLPSSKSVSIIAIPGKLSAAGQAIMQFGIQSDAAGQPSGTWICQSAPTTFSNTVQAWETA